MPEPTIGMLVIPLAPPNPECVKAMMERLRGHAMSDLWLPDDTGWPEFDEVREKHLAARAHVDHALGELAELREKHSAENKAHEEAHIEAAEAGKHEVDDHRTPPQERRDQEADIADRVWAGVLVLADRVDDVIELVRANLEHWLAYLNSKREPAAEKRRAAERLAHEADIEEYGLAQRANWLKMTATDGAYGKQPFPQPAPRPKQMAQSLISSAFELRLYEKDDIPTVSHMEASGVSVEEYRARQAELRDPGDLPDIPEPNDGQPLGDPTGTVSAIDEMGARR